MNIRDIARLADVTPGTVSKVLNNYPDVGEATRQHVLKIIAENQYEPKGRGKKAEALPPRIGMVVESVYNPFYSEVEDSLSIHLHNAGYTLISFHDNFFAQNKREKFAELLTGFQPEKLNGLIYIGGNFEEVTPEEFSQLPCPTIFVNTMLPYPTGKLLYSSVQVSQFATAYAQMERLKSEAQSAGGIVADIEYGAGVTLKVLVPGEQSDAFAARIFDQTAGSVQVRVTGESFRAVPVR